MTTINAIAIAGVVLTGLLVVATERLAAAHRRLDAALDARERARFAAARDHADRARTSH